LARFWVVTLKLLGHVFISTRLEHNAHAKHISRVGN
jgi:hypothetical protein